jgi:DNA repair ATPase RecN
MRTYSDFKKVFCAVILLAGLTGLVCLNGCKPDKGNLDQIEALKTELANVQQRLDEATSQAATSKLNLEALALTLAQTQETVETLARLPKENDAIDTSLAEVVNQRDAAMAEAKETRAMLVQLQRQLAQQIQMTDKLGAQVADLQKKLAPPVIKAAAEESEPKSNGPIVGFPEVPGFKD